jgi:protocatechuate 4,5-dioxygenase alpha chain
MSHLDDIPGTPVFDGRAARRGYALNRMCFSLNKDSNRRRLRANEEAYCAEFGLDAEQTKAVLAKNVLELIKAGGNIYYLAKLAGTYGLDMQDIGAQQTGVNLEAFKTKLAQAGA